MENPSYVAKPCRYSVGAWEVWDVDHPHPGNHFPVLLIDSKGASDDLHEEMARVCAEALSKRFPGATLKDTPAS